MRDRVEFIVPPHLKNGDVMMVTSQGIISISDPFPKNHTYPHMIPSQVSVTPAAFPCLIYDQHLRYKKYGIKLISANYLAYF